MLQIEFIAAAIVLLATVESQSSSRYCPLGSHPYAGGASTTCQSDGAICALGYTCTGTSGSLYCCSSSVQGGGGTFNANNNNNNNNVFNDGNMNNGYATSNNYPVNSANSYGYQNTYNTANNNLNNRYNDAANSNTYNGNDNNDNNIANNIYYYNQNSAQWAMAYELNNAPGRYFTAYNPGYNSNAPANQYCPSGATPSYYPGTQSVPSCIVGSGTCPYPSTCQSTGASTSGARGYCCNPNMG